MMYKCMRYQRFILFIITLITTFTMTTIKSYSEPNDKVLVIYESSTNSIDKLIKEKNNHVETIHIYDYDNVNLNDYDYVVIIDTNIYDLDIVEDINKYKRDIYYIGNGIEYFLNLSDKYDLEYFDKSNNIHTIKYNNKEVYLDDYDDFNIVKLKKDYNKNKVKVLATMDDGYNEYFYAIQNKNLTYISKYVISEDVKKNLNQINNNDNNLDQDKSELEEGIKSLNKAIVTMIILVLIMFSVIFVYFRYINKNKFRR